MKKTSAVFIFFLIFIFLPEILSAAQKAQRTTTSCTYDSNKTSSNQYENFGVTKATTGSSGGGSTATPTNLDGTPAMNKVVNDDPAISISSDGTINLINSAADSSGSVWYSGSGSSSVCNACTNGVCPFGIGFRAYFEFKSLYADQSARSDVTGDGFTFAFMNASNNTTTDRGGVPDGTSMGSLIGYAGPGDTTYGIRPPKFAVEFDLYPNNTGETNFCSSGRYDNAGSYDYYGSSGNTSNHIALMFWGRNITSYCTVNGTYYSQASFDDNYHGAGDGSTSYPYNSSLSGNGSGLGGYYERARNSTTKYNWMEDQAWHRVRIEVIRIPSTYTYEVKAWVDCETTSGSSTCPASEYLYFQDIYSPYTNTTYLPKIDRTVTLSYTYNTMLNNILFGFTEGSGEKTQDITIANFAVYFPTLSIACSSGSNYTCTTSPAGASHTYSAATGAVAVTAAASSCPWTAHSTYSWITVTNDNVERTGSGTVTYSVAANTGSARTGTITIGGETFTVTQAAGPPSCTLVAGSSIVPYSDTNTLTWTVTGSATSASWSWPSPGGTCGSSPSTSGGSCTTAAQTSAGARTYTLSVTNANGTNSCSATFYVGCQGYTVYNNTGSRRDFRITNSSCSRTSYRSAISGTLNTGETVTRYATNNRSCGSAQGAFGYTDAMNVDIVTNGGNGDCRVNYNSNDTASDY